MREILFKAKREIDGEWIYGNLLRTDDGTFIIQNYAPFEGIGKYMVDPETICQYTGLTDKNGKKIWENDIVYCRKYIGGNQIDYHIELGYIEMKHGAFGLHRKQGYYRPLKDWLEDYEYDVIGNVFDNPELLEQERFR